MALKVGGVAVTVATKATEPRPKAPAKGSVEDLGRRLDKVMLEYGEAAAVAVAEGGVGWWQLWESAHAAAGLFLRLADKGEVPVGWEDAPVLPSEAGGAEVAVVCYLLLGTNRR